MRVRTRRAHCPGRPRVCACGRAQAQLMSGGRTQSPDAKIRSLPKKDSSGFFRVGRRVKGEGELRLWWLFFKMGRKLPRKCEEPAETVWWEVCREPWHPPPFRSISCWSLETAVLSRPPGESGLCRPVRCLPCFMHSCFCVCLALLLVFWTQWVLDLSFRILKWLVSGSHLHSFRFSGVRWVPCFWEVPRWLQLQWCGCKDRLGELLIHISASWHPGPAPPTTHFCK